jgi:alkanesulfonate monooxygenase SsuD/methylene tetrahydromethanopterin reductase-like flavin-dependent oxidoreductase (luciferase family)
MQAEFRAMGLKYPPVRERQAALAEGLRLIPRLLRGETVSFRGAYCRLDGVKLHPAAVQQPYVPLLVGGGGERSTLRLVAQHADASNLVAETWGGAAATTTDVQHKYNVLQRYCSGERRPYGSVLRTYSFIPALLADSLAGLAVKREAVPQQVLAFTGAAALVGTPQQAVEQIRPLVNAGCQYFIFAVLEIDTLRLLAERVLPSVMAGLSTP